MICLLFMKFLFVILFYIKYNYMQSILHNLFLFYNINITKNFYKII